MEIKSFFIEKSKIKTIFVKLQGQRASHVEAINLGNIVIKTWWRRYVLTDLNTALR